MPKPRSRKPDPKTPQPARTPAATRIPAPARAPAPAREKWLLWLGAILLLTYFIYQPSLDNGFTNWDDDYYVTQNAIVAHPTLHALVTEPSGGNYHPLTMASLALNYAISGTNAVSYHWLNLFLHLANTALVFLFIRKLTGGRLWTTVVTSLFFGIHPMHVESVAWIAERKDVLYALFYLLGLITYLRYLDRQRLIWLLPTWLAFVLSVASKPAAVVFPITLLAIDYFKRRPYSLRLVLEKIPFLLVSIAGGLLTLYAQKSVGAVAAPHQWSIFQKILFASYGTCMYVVKLFLPLRLSAIYPYPAAEGAPMGSEYYIAFAALLILLPTVLYLFRRNRVVLFGIAFFFINIALVLQFISVGQAVMADRYTYLPYIGLFFALSWWLDERPGTKVAGISLRANLAALFLALMVVSLIQTWKRCDVWQDAGALWNDTIRNYPNQIFDAYNNRGVYLIAQNRYEEALADLNHALALNPRVARAWVNKGSVYAETNRNDSAYVCFERAIEIKPDYPEALTNRGGIRSRRGDLVGAVEDCTKAIQLNPTFRGAYMNRASTYFKMGEFEKAVEDRRRVIELDPRNPENYIQMGSIALALAQLDRTRDAIAAYDEAIRTAPPEDRQRLAGYHLRRSQTWWRLKERERALIDAQAAKRLGADVDSAYIRELEGFEDTRPRTGNVPR